MRNVTAIVYNSLIHSTHKGWNAGAKVMIIMQIAKSRKEILR